MNKKITRIEDFVTMQFIIIMILGIMFTGILIVNDRKQDERYADLQSEFSLYKDLYESDINTLEVKLTMLENEILEFKQHINDMNYVTNENLSLMIEEKVIEYNKEYEK